MINQNRPLEPQNFLRVITIIHLALILGVTLFGIVTFSLNIGRNTLIFNGSDPFTLVSLFLAIGGIVIGTIVFKKQLANAQSRTTLGEKLGLYQSALIQRFAFVEGAAMFAVVSYDLTANLYFLIIAGLLVVYFITIRPTKDKAETDLNLDYEDKIAMSSSNSII